MLPCSAVPLIEILGGEMPIACALAKDVQKAVMNKKEHKQINESKKLYFFTAINLLVCHHKWLNLFFSF